MGIIKKVIQAPHHIVFQICVQDKLGDFAELFGAICLPVAIIISGGLCGLAQMVLGDSAGPLIIVFFPIGLAFPVLLVRFFIKRKRIVFELTPIRMQLSTTYGGIAFRKPLRMPTTAFQISDINVYFNEGRNKEISSRPILGINYQEKTITISGANLTLSEINTLAHDIRQYLSTVLPHSHHGSQVNARLQQTPLTFSDSNVHFQVVVRHDHSVRFYTPVDLWELRVTALRYGAIGCIFTFAMLFVTWLTHEPIPWIVEGWTPVIFCLIPGISLSLFVSALVLRPFTKYVTELTPTTLRVTKECFGKTIGTPKQLAIAALQPSQIYVFFDEVGNEEHVPTVGINSRETTLKIPYPKRYRDESEYLVQQMRTWLAVLKNS